MRFQFNALSDNVFGWNNNNEVEDSGPDLLKVWYHLQTNVQPDLLRVHTENLEPLP